MLTIKDLRKRLKCLGISAEPAVDSSFMRSEAGRHPFFHVIEWDVARPSKTQASCLNLQQLVWGMRML